MRDENRICVYLSVFVSVGAAEGVPERCWCVRDLVGGCCWCETCCAAARDVFVCCWSVISEDGWGHGEEGKEGVERGREHF